MKAIAANVPVAWPHDGAQRDKGSGEQLAAIYRKEGLLMLGQHATHPTGGNGTEAGIMEMQTRMRDGRFKIGAATLEWQEEFQGYHRKNGLIVKANDDLLSATRIGIMQLRSARAVPLGSTRRDRSRKPQIAEGVDFDVFSGTGEVISQERLNEGREAAAYFDIDLKTGKRRKPSRLSRR